MKTGLTVVFVALALGLLAGRFAAPVWEMINSQLQGAHYLYVTQNPELLERHRQSKANQIGWDSLLPEAEKKVLRKYQNSLLLDPETQILKSIQASNDSAYLNAIYSMNTVEDLIGEFITIPGYIVPIELDDERKVSSFFLVPYFGACLHYPPPAPNQMIYMRLTHSIPMPDINLAYSVSGVLNTALFEDLLGTSAYSLELITMEAYSGQPDDFRQH